MTEDNAPKIDGWICGGNHDFTGPAIHEENMSSVTCRHCGMAQIDYDMMRLP